MATKHGYWIRCKIQYGDPVIDWLTQDGFECSNCHRAYEMSTNNPFPYPTCPYGRAIMDLKKPIDVMKED